MRVIYELRINVIFVKDILLKLYSSNLYNYNQLNCNVIKILIAILLLDNKLSKLNTKVL